MKCNKKYQKIINELIKKSFPELKNSVPKVFELKVSKLHGIYLPIINKIGINKLCRNFPRDEIKGIMAHELCHAEILKKIGFLKTLYLFFIYWFSSSLRKRNEEEADKLAIEKGYAKNLIYSSSRLEKMYPKYKDKTFMSVQKIKQYAKRVGKL